MKIKLLVFFIKKSLKTKSNTLVCSIVFTHPLWLCLYQVTKYECCWHIIFNPHASTPPVILYIFSFDIYAPPAAHLQQR